MSYDTIKFLNLEEFPIDISSFQVSKVRNILTAYFRLVNHTTNCIHCQSKEIVIKDYRVKKVKHSISNASSCFLGYKARRFFCRKCLKTFYEPNPSSIKGESIYTKSVQLIVAYPKWTGNTFLDNFHIDSALLYSTRDK